MAPEFLIDGPNDAPATIILAHGAGAAMDSPFMHAFATALAARGLKCVRFEFPYMARRRLEGTKRPPDRAPVLLQTWRNVIERFGPQNLIVGGKSMGGRMASMVAREYEDNAQPLKGLVCLGYPFCPPRKPDKVAGRIAHLREIKTPTLILQGTRDPFGKRDQMSTLPLSNAITFHWLEDGDHDFKPRKKSGRTQAQNWCEASDAMDAFVRSL